MKSVGDTLSNSSASLTQQINLDLGPPAVQHPRVKKAIKEGQGRAFRMNPNIKILLDTSKNSREKQNEGYKQLKELESKALEYQRECTNLDSLRVPDMYLAEAREKFHTLSQLIVSGHDVFDRALEEFQNLILLYAAQSKRHGEVPGKKYQQRASIEAVLNHVKETNDRASRKWGLAEGDYRELLTIERRWVKEKQRSDRAKEMDHMNLEDATMDDRIYKHLRNMIGNEASENSEAQRDLRSLLLTERKYSTLHPEEQKNIPKTPELVQRSKAKGGSTRQPHRGVLHRSASQSSLSSEESEEAGKGPSVDEKKIAISTERLQEMREREKLYQAKIEELTTRLSSFASKQLLEGNPNIADLSDPNRPTKLCEKFNNIYDNEWSEAFEELQKGGMKDDAIISLLMDIIINAERFCKDVKEQQLQRLMDSMRHCMVHVNWTTKEEDVRVNDKSTSHDPKSFASLSKYAKDFRKASAKASVPSLCVMFKEMYIREGRKLEYKNQPNLEHYIDGVVEFVWLMSVQDPPMSLCWQKEGEQMDKKSYKYYERRGDVVRLTVWPAVYLYEKGPIVSKGFIWPK